MRKSKEDTHQMTLRIPLSLYDEMKKALDESGLLTTEFILRAIREKLDSIRSSPHPAEGDGITRAEIRRIIREELFAATPNKKEVLLMNHR